MAEYKVTKGIYMRKYQAKNISKVGGACVEKQRIQRNFAMCLIHLVKFSQCVSSWCEVAKFRTMKKISLRNFRKEKFTLRNWSFDMIQLPSEGHNFLISAPNYTQFEALDS